MTDKIFAYTGTYQDQFWSSDIHRPRGEHFTVPAHGVGIGRYVFEAKSGKLTLQGHTYIGNNPATLWVSPNQKYLYAAHETKNLDGVLGAGGGVSAFAIDQETGDLTYLNTVSSCGTFACFVTCDRTGQYVVAANHASYFYSTKFEKQPDGDYRPRVEYDIGALALYRVRADGGLEEACDVQVLPGCGYDVDNQRSAHPHAVKVTPDDYVIAPNKGADSVDVFKLDRENHRLVPVQNFPATPGAAPRHIAIHPTKPLFFIVNEFNNMVVSYRWERDSGKLCEIGQVFTVPPQFVGKSYTSCEIEIHPGGEYIYVTNHPPFFSIAAYRVNPETGELTLIGNFREEMTSFREFRIDPSGKYLVGGSMKGDFMAVFAIEQDTGMLRLVDDTAPAIYPSCIHFAAVK